MNDGRPGGLWLIACKAFPKQFTDLTGKFTLFLAPAPQLKAHGQARPIIVTGPAFGFVGTGQLPTAGVDDGAVPDCPDRHHRGADRRLSGQGRDHPLRGCLCP